MVDSHWICYDTGKPFVPNLDKFGFVYIITNTKTGKAYVGYKQYFMGKAKKKMKWETYISSSKYLKADIKKIGKKHFTFEVIAEYKNKRSLNYYEMYHQVKYNVLHATLEGSDEQAFYNHCIGGRKFFRPIESYKPLTEDHKLKISEAKSGVPNTWLQGEKHHDYKGKTEFYLDGKRMVVDCLGAWCNENGYPKGSLNQIARTTRDGFYKIKTKKSGKNRRFYVKGHLGIITKVKYLGKEVKDVNQESNV
jgi:hypothetical protein